MSGQQSTHNRRSWLFCLAAGLIGTLINSGAYAANPTDWWVDIAQNRAADVQSMLAQGADLNELGPEGQPAIMAAIRHNAWDAYDVLAASPKMDVNQANVSDETPLMYLAIVGETKRAQTLIKRGAQVNRLGWTPLHYAASKGQLAMVKLLIADKAIINAPAPDGTTALMMAAFAGSEPVVRALLGAGADVATQNLKAQDAADWALLSKHGALAQKIRVLIDDKRRQRAALRARSEAEMPADVEPGNTGVDSLDAKINNLEKSAPAQPSGGEMPGSQGAKNTNSNDHSSRYFDLNRFNK
ncbi:MAG: ankyrin repeat domain-containing protein [Burkholderiaceae bacterium]